MAGEGLDFGLLGGQDKTPQTADYRTAGSHQAENLQYEFVTVSATWEEIYVVPTGKTYYVSAVIISPAASATMYIGTGASASEAEFLVVVGATTIINLDTPIKFSSGTRIAVKTSTENDVHFSLVGWTE